jgi:hypothetical protein
MQIADSLRILGALTMGFGGLGGAGSKVDTGSISTGQAAGPAMSIATSEQRELQVADESSIHAGAGGKWQNTTRSAGWEENRVFFKRAASSKWRSGTAAWCLMHSSADGGGKMAPGAISEDH